MINAKLTYRPSQKEDLPQMLDIWKKYSGWGQITAEDYLKWYVNTPYGESLIIVTTEESTGRIFGQLILIPSRLIIDNHTVKGYRLFAPVIHGDIRGTDIKDFNHPVFSMFRFSVEIAKEQGYSFLYSFPSVGWLPVFRSTKELGLSGSTTATYGCTGIPYSREGFDKSLLPKRYNVLETKIFTEDFDSLWEQAVVELPVRCGVVRKKERLAYKLSPHFVLEGRDEKNELVGYIAIRKMNALIVDALAKSTEDLKHLMHDAIRFLYELKQKEQSPLGDNSEVKCIRFPQMEHILSTIEHNVISFDFAFANCLIDEKLSLQSATADKWWMMPDD